MLGKLVFLIPPLILLLVNPARAEKSVDEVLQEAERSPLLRAKFPAAEVQRRGLGTIQLDRGVRLNLAAYLNATSLKANSRYQPLFRPEVATAYLKTPARDSETVIQMKDRVLVDRRITFKLKPGICRQANLPAHIADQCFLPKAGQTTPETRAVLEGIRTKLRAAPASREVIEGVTAGFAAHMQDEQLLDLLLNHGERDIRLLSHIPTRLVDPKLLAQSAKDWALRDIQLNAEMPIYSIVPQGTPSSPSRPYEGRELPAVVKRPLPVSAPDPALSEPRHFLTGVTLGREIRDKYEYTFARESWWHDRYYLRLSYHVGAGIGLRMPFQVRAETSGVATALPPRIAGDNRLSPRPGMGTLNRPTPASVPSNVSANRKREVSVVIRPEDLKDAWSAVGLDQGKYFEGREFVLEFNAGCSLKVSIPGPNPPPLKCPTPSVQESQDILPAIGQDNTQLGPVWIVDGQVWGLGVNAGIGGAYLDLGLAANLTNGRFTMQISPFPGNQIEGLSGPDLVFSSGNPQRFSLLAQTGDTPSGFVLEKPRYQVTAAISPAARGRVNIDLGIYEFNKTVGPFILDMVRLEQEFELGRHDGTVAKHRFPL